MRNIEREMLCVDAVVMVRGKKEVKKEVISHGNGIWWKIGICVLIGILIARKFF